MTATMVPQDQQGLGLTPTSRQDVISALLDDYAMGRSDASPFEISPVPALKELPPPPPVEREGNWSYEKPLPQVRQMSMRFQLRVDEPVSPDSPDGSRSSMDSPPTRIVSRSMSRGSKPPSLRLLASNGSTATLPPTPALPSSTRTPVTASRLSQEEEKSLPPPPPAKSERRQSLKDRPAAERPTRYDSLVDREDRNDRPGTAGAVKRKPVPKFTSLAELGNGPRGGKGGPLPQPRTRKQSVEKEQEAFNEDRPATAVEARIVDIPERPSKSSIKSQDRDVSPPRPAPPMISQMPPTPDEKVSPLPPPKKPFAGMGLPSNPRAKGQETPKHIRGKSSTGFDLMMKNATSAPQPNNIITPGPTPSPGTTEQIKEERSPIPHVENAEQRRPFSFESIAPAPPQKAAEMPGPASARPASPVSPIEVPANSEAFPPRSTSRAPPTFANLPSQQRAATPEERSTTPEDELSPPTPTTPVFTPLTVKPEPSDAPAITPKHLECYSHHSTFVWSKNDFQPMACMICHSNDRERKWACVWCYLRICVGCSEELMKTPGRDLSKVVETRGALPALEKVDSRHDSGTAANPSVVVWGAEDEYGERGYGRENEDDFS